MTLADSGRQRGDWIRKVAALQLQIADLRTLIDVTMHTRPHPVAMKLLAMADVHLESAAQELSEAAAHIGAIV